MQLTWLHLSDLHFNPGKTGWDAARVLETLKNDLMKMQAEHGLVPDLIFFTGDAAFGQEESKPQQQITEQFDGALSFLEAVRNTFTPAVEKSRVFIVPGNHDVNRSNVSPSQTEWLDRVSDPNVVINEMQRNTYAWKRYMVRLSDYRDFLTRHGFSHLLQRPNDLMYASTLEIDGVKIGIGGFNSAWSCCRPDEKGKLWVGSHWQVETIRLAVAEADIKIALIHHPPNWFVQFEDPLFRRESERDFDFLLHGHEHQEWIETAEGHVRIAAGACYERSDRDNGYNFVRLNLEHGTGEVWLRKYHSRGAAWIQDIIPNKTDDLGRWPLTATPKLATTSTSCGVTDPDPTKSAKQESVIDITLGGRPSQFLTYNSDPPPVVDAWVGRDHELSVLRRSRSGVIAVTGIGGQGKSSTVAKFLEWWRAEYPESVWDWRDCREEGERFHTQLISMITQLSGGRVTGENLADGEVKDLVKYLFEVADGLTGLLVLDNVDHYVDSQAKWFLYGIDMFVEEAIRRQHNLLIVLTCRPRVIYPSTRFEEINLTGLHLDECTELFKLRGVSANDETISRHIEEIWSLTDGHPFWLNLLAVHMSHNQGKADEIIRELRKGHIDDRAKAMFYLLWKGLNDKQRSILRCMAEIPYPETSESIFSMARPFMTRNQANRAFNALRTSSLVVSRESGPWGAEYDLHPLVRNFIRTEFPSKQERQSFIRPVLVFINQFIGNSSEVEDNAPLDIVERWTTKAELEYESQDIKGALKALCGADDRLIAAGYHEEFIRIARMLIDETNWQSPELLDWPAFHSTVRSLISTLVEHGRETDARAYLSRFESVIRPGSTSYIGLCKTACYMEWMLGNYDSAVKWGSLGIDLKSGSKIDTREDMFCPWASETTSRRINVRFERSVHAAFQCAARMALASASLVWRSVRRAAGSPR